MAINTQRARELLRQFDFRRLFAEELSWASPAPRATHLEVDGKTYTATPIAEQGGMMVFEVLDAKDGLIPGRDIQLKATRRIAQTYAEHILIFVNMARTASLWLWVKRQDGRLKPNDRWYYRTQPGDSLLQELAGIAFELDELDEEGRASIGLVLDRMDAAFHAERVTKRFYERFAKEHAAFLKFMDGIPDDDMQKWYASVMLNRLMFIYFIQKKGFLGGDQDYLRHKLDASDYKRGFYRDFLCPLFFKGFAQKEEDRSDADRKMLGPVPYLNGGIFQQHEIERLHGKTIAIPDKAFAKVFDFFDDYRWHLDDRPLQRDDEINPDVLGYIFEKYINQKQMGAYYTKEDITGYISRNTILPFMFDAVRQKCRAAFDGEASVWSLLSEDPDRYIYEDVRKGVDLPLPPEIEIGVDPKAPELFERRKHWNKPAPAEYALPTEIWRETVARRQRYTEIKSTISHQPSTISINDLITLNLDIVRFAQDVVENAEPDLLNAFYTELKTVTVLDPTCGSGAFLFAALNILYPLYEACLNRMRLFLDEWQRVGDKTHRNYAKWFTAEWKAVEDHPNQRYFILKTIILNNLYGVDLMKEATEICKLRLFLKLAAQVEPAPTKPNYGIEPLPDIDFNIRAGNTLVGFATKKQAEDVLRQDLLAYNTVWPEIKEEAENAARAYQQFKDQQTQHGGQVTADEKAALAAQFLALEDKLNRYLAEDYGVDLKKKVAFDKWLSSHQPFHWFIDFYGIMSKDGFDVIIGNPPYVEYGTTLRRAYQVRGYLTLDCGNLHALIVERCFGISTSSGCLGFIVPLPSISTSRMSTLQAIVKPSPRRKGRHLWVSAFDERPSNLFTGVDQRLIVEIFGAQCGTPLLATTGINRWASRTRGTLFPCLSYAIQEVATRMRTPTILKIKRAALENRLLECFYENDPIERVRSDRPTKQILGYRTAGGRYWKVVLDKPFGSQALSEKTAYLDGLTGLQAVACISSSTFWWYYSVHFDMYNLKDYMLFGFRFSGASETTLMELHRLGRSMVQSLEANAQCQRIETLTRGNVKQKLYVASRSKPIIDEIDRVLAKHYGFTDEELDFIINYDIKYRMGLSGEKESDE